MKKWLSMWVLIFCFADQSHASEVFEYTWLTVGEASGAQTTTISDAGEVAVAFHFSDRGRGPETKTTVRLNANGVPTAVSISGKNYLKGAVDERFTVDDGKATWASAIEQGDAPFDGEAFFYPFNSPPELLAMLVRAALASDDDSVELLPTGRVSVSVIDETTLLDGDRTTSVTLYGVQGLDTSATYIWLDDKKQFFGADFGWFGIVRAGFEHHINTLKLGQDNADDVFFSEVKTRHAQPLDDLLVIRGARVFDAVDGVLTQPATVMVFEGKITAVDFDPVEVPEGARVIDAQGHTLLPTLWDMHGHVGIGSYLNYLAAGVTNVRDMANDHEVTLKLARDVRRGVIAGPDIYTLGFVDKRGEFSAPTGRLADSLDDAKSHVRFYAQHGYAGIKLYSSIEPPWVKPLATLAHKLGLSVQGHVPAYMNAEQAIHAGYDEITHINMVLLNFLKAEELDTRTPVRFLVPGEKGGDIDLASTEVRKFVRLMQEKDTALDPTLNIFMDMFLNEPGKVSPVFRDIADHLPANTRRNTIASTGFNDGKEKAFAAAAKRSMELTKLLHDQGIRLLPGTDNMLPGFTLIRELLYYAQAGIPAHEVLQLATIESARHLAQDARLGSVSVGKDAHMYLVEGNPLEDLTALYKVRQVIKGDTLYHAPDLLTEQGFKPFE
ncbi:MAG: amidohydrolase family protein [Lysobacterales bacterium]